MLISFLRLFFFFLFSFLPEVPLCFTMQASAKCQQCERPWMLMSTVLVPSLPLETCWLGLQPPVPLDPQSCLAASYPACPAPLITVSGSALPCDWLCVCRALQGCRRQPGFCVATLKSQRRPAWFSPAQQTHHRPHRRLSHQSPAFICCLDLKPDVKKTQSWTGPIWVFLWLLAWRTRTV